MTYSISQTDPANLSTEEIFVEIKGFQSLAVNVLKRWSSLLAELKRRRVENIMFAHPVLKFWESICSNTLDAQAAVLLADKKDGKFIRAVLPLPPSEQLEIARGREIAIASRTVSGDIKIDDIPIFRMDDSTLRRAFGPEGIRTVHEQAEIIRSEAKIERHGAITVDRTHGRLRIGNQTFTPDEFEAAFLALGYKIVLARDVSAKAG